MCRCAVCRCEGERGAGRERGLAWRQAGREGGRANREGEGVQDVDCCSGDITAL